jgi:hypothetical protein
MHLEFQDLYLNVSLLYEKIPGINFYNYMKCRFSIYYLLFCLVDMQLKD